MMRVFISGVSDGIGLALAKLYLDKGCRVYGISRRKPESLLNHERFHFRSLDLQGLKDGSDLFSGELARIAVEGVSVLHLNAGISGGVPLPAAEVTLESIQQTLYVNALANKVILDTHLALAIRPDVVVASASIAGSRFRAGMLPYSLSKAALTAMCGVYAQENPDVFFAVIGLCNVDTKLSREIVFGPRVPEFPDHVALQERFSSPGYVSSPEERATHIFNLVHEKRDERMRSGHYVNVRDLL